MSILDIRTLYLNKNCTARWAGELYTGGRGRVSGGLSEVAALEGVG